MEIADLEEGRPPLKTLALAAALYAISLILIDIAPFFIGMYVDALGLSLSEAGFIQTIDQAGGILGAITAFFLMPQFSWRTLMIAATCIAMLANVLTALADSYSFLATVRFLSGFGVVMITAVTACVLARAVSPDRAFGIGLALGMSLSALAIWLLDAVRQEFGLMTSLGSGALWLALGIVFAFMLPSQLGSRQPMPTSASSVPTSIEHTNLMGWAALTALFLFGLSVNVVYAYVERVGLANGLDQVGVANALAFGYVFSAIGCTVPTVFGAVGGRMRWIVLTTLLLLGSLLALYQADSVSLYTLAFGIYASAWNMGLAYYMSLTADNDPEERFTRMMYIATVAAQSIGPAIAAIALTGAPLSIVFVIAPIPALMAVILVLVIARKTHLQKQ